MTTRLVHVVIDANDPARLGEFWARALGWQILPVDPDEIVIAPAGFDSIYPDPVALPREVRGRLTRDSVTCRGRCSPIPRAVSSACGCRGRPPRDIRYKAAHSAA